MVTAAALEIGDVGIIDWVYCCTLNLVKFVLANHLDALKILKGTPHSVVPLGCAADEF